MAERRLPKYTVCQDNMAKLLPHAWPDGLPMFCVGLNPDASCAAAYALALQEAERYPGMRFVVVGPEGEEIHAVQLEEAAMACPF